MATRLSDLWLALDVNLAAAQAAAETLDQTDGSGSQVVDAVSRVDAAAKAVQDKATDLASTIRALDFDAAIATESQDTTSEIAWAKTSAEVLLYLIELREGMRAMRGVARQRVQQSTKLYRVKPGDTLESIAQSQLGGRGRASDLHLTSSALQPGRLIRLPV